MLTAWFDATAFGVLGVGLVGVICYLVYIVFLRIKWQQTLKRRRLFLEEMRKLPIFLWSDELSASDTCCSCCNTFAPQAEITIFPCQHSCHTTCAEEWILRNNLRCPLCHGEIVQNSRIFTESDITASPETVLRGTRRGELVPLLRTSLFQELKLRLGNRRQSQYLRVPSDLEDSSSTSNKGPTTTPTPTPPEEQETDRLLQPPRPLKSAIYTPGNVDRPKTVRLTTGTPPPPEYSDLELEGVSVSNGEDDEVCEEDGVLSIASVLKRFALSRDSVFSTPATKEEPTPGGSGTSGSGRSLYHSLPSSTSREVRVEIHRAQHEQQLRSDRDRPLRPVSTRPPTPGPHDFQL